MRASRSALSIHEELALGQFVAVALDLQSALPRRHRASIDGLPEAIEAAMRVGTALGWCEKPKGSRGKLRGNKGRHRS